MNQSERAIMNGADIIVDFLTRQKVPYLFGLCGHGNVGFLDAAFKAQDRIRTISVHHEQTAGHMADAYFKVRHEPVATFTSCGPGSANLVMALAAAMMDSSAFFAITGNVPTSQFNRNPFQETGRYYQGDFPSVIRPYVKRSYQPTRVDMMPLAVRQGWELMLSGRPGPVNLDVPLNVFVEEAEVTPPQASARIVNAAPGNPEALTAALKVLLAAERPVIIAGQGVLLAEAVPALQEFAELTSIPVVTSPNGKGSISERHRLAFGSIGRNGTYAANEATRNADVILALGFTFDDRATSAWLDGYTLAIPPSRLIQIDIDPAELGRNYPAEFPILGCARASLAFLNGLVRAGAPPVAKTAWLARLNHGREVWQTYQSGLAASDQVPLRPERLMRALSRAIPENAIVASDVGVHHNWIIQLFDALRPRQLIHSWGFAAMGFATSGILGAKLAAPDRPCVAVVGDGSFMMTPHALATAVEHDIPVVWVVWNNNGYCSIRDIQHGMFAGRELATSFRKDHGNKELFSADFAALARSMGVAAHTVTHAGEVEDAIKTAIAANRPYLVEVPVDRDIRPIGTGSWELPPLPQPEPNFLKALAAAGLSV
ncbi:MAG TPA: thiamine pyrophosphate-binding protein [Rhodopila sp.]|nr:thiamine pyrophosphate-binding protein [Rhodopila sp.]